MSSRNRSTRIVSFVAGFLLCGMATLQAARAQDADPNAPPVGAYQVSPAGAPPAVEQSGVAPYKPFLLMPFVGLQSIQNDNSGTGPGLRIGGLVGARINEQISLNGELLFDLENFSNVPANASESAYFVQFAAAPLFHVQASPTAEIVMGPKLGLFVEHASASVYGLELSGNAEGLLVGANLGAFYRLSDALALGGLINFDYMKMEWCSNDQGSCTVSDDGLKVISFTGAAQF